MELEAVNKRATCCTIQGSKLTHTIRWTLGVRPSVKEEKCSPGHDISRTVANNEKQKQKKRWKTTFHWQPCAHWEGFIPKLFLIHSFPSACWIKQQGCFMRSTLCVQSRVIDEENLEEHAESGEMERRILSRLKCYHFNEEFLFLPTFSSHLRQNG